MTTTVDLLARCRIFAEFPRPLLDELAALASVAEIPAGRQVTTAGQAPDKLIVVAAGRFRIESAGDEVAQLGVGDAIGEISLIDDGVASANAVALRPSLVVELPSRRSARSSCNRPRACSGWWRSSPSGYAWATDDRARARPGLSQSGAGPRPGISSTPSWPPPPTPGSLTPSARSGNSNPTIWSSSMASGPMPCRHRAGGTNGPPDRSRSAFAPPPRPPPGGPPRSAALAGSLVVGGGRPRPARDHRTDDAAGGRTGRGPRPRWRRLADVGHPRCPRGAARSGLEYDLVVGVSAMSPTAVLLGQGQPFDEIVARTHRFASDIRLGRDLWPSSSSITTGRSLTEAARRPAGTVSWKTSLDRR